MYDHDFFPFIGMPYGFGWVFMILFWGLIITAVIVLVRWMIVGVAPKRDQGQSTAVHRTPSDILRERYARGEIDREEFIQRLDDLNEH